MPPKTPLVALRAVRLGFGGRPLFEGLDLALAAGDRACLIGRNGSGKSTLMKVLAGFQDIDGGESFRQPGARVAYLPQDPVLPAGESVLDYAAAGLPAEESGESHRAAATLAALDLAGDRRLETLSGGEGRRAALARALVSRPDVLLLDEPTNHLDLPTITWLEQELSRFRGALLVVSHDRAFLGAVSQVTLWLNRGQVKRLERGYASFEAWAEAEAEREAEERHRLDRKIKREERWLARGVTARRKRNQGRLAKLRDLRRQRAEWLGAPGSVKLGLAAGAASGALVIEADKIAKSYPGPDGEPRPVVRDFSTRIRRGDRIGLVGPNGAGKTTLLRLLCGELEPDSGTVRLGTNLTPRYFDQRRESLDPEASLWETLVPGGGDSLEVGGRQRHVVGYLRDFLFDEGQARQPVKSLSGGEKNRLLLARLFARPGNLLLLDEPTNDLDMETLDLLLEVLDGYDGTLMVVSHDRDFLDRLVSGLFVLAGDGGVDQVVGGYSDYRALQTGSKPAVAKPGKGGEPSRQRRSGGAKLSYRDQRELDRLPGEIERLTAQVADLESALADPGFYGRDPNGFADATERLGQAQSALESAETRWLELEEQREGLAARSGGRE